MKAAYKTLKADQKTPETGAADGYLRESGK